METKCRKDDGYRGIWYSCAMQTHGYSGGLGTYCAKHRPFAVYCENVRKTFFCYGGTTKESFTNLLHMVSYYDHERDIVPRPTILLDKETGDAHDNPTISVDDEGYIWIFSTAHGTARPACVHRSTRPYEVDDFEHVRITGLVEDKEREITNFSYMQPWHVPGKGFLFFHTRYDNPTVRSLWFARSRDGAHWECWHNQAAVAKGHYEISTANAKRAGTAFNYHPSLSPFIRTNLYYMETEDLGETWSAADGTPLQLPLTEVVNAALVHDYSSENLLVYMKDIIFGPDGRPVILYLTSAGNMRGPESAPRRWTTARWTGKEWLIRPAMESGDNYDTGSLYIEEDNTWRLIAPTDDGPQPDHTGGEMVMWTSNDQGSTWTRAKEMTHGSSRNHTYARRPVNAHPEFYALWADGLGGHEPSDSQIYFCDRGGNVRVLPEKMENDFAQPSVSGDA